MFYSGESNVPGAPGNLLAGAPSFDINRRPGALGGRSGEQLKRLYEGGTQQNEKLNEELRNRGIMPGSGPQLPMAGIGNAIGNMAGMANDQFFRGPQFGQAFDAMAMEPPYTERERSEDQIILRSLQKGEMGSGPLIDKAIQDLIQRTSMGGTGLRGV